MKYANQQGDKKPVHLRRTDSLEFQSNQRIVTIHNSQMKLESCPHSPSSPGEERVGRGRNIASLMSSLGLVNSYRGFSLVKVYEVIAACSGD